MDARGGRTGGRRLGGGWRPRCGRVRRARGVGGRATAAAPRTERMRKNVSRAATGTLSRRDAAPRGEARGGRAGRRADPEPRRDRSARRLPPAYAQGNAVGSSPPRPRRATRTSGAVSFGGGTSGDSKEDEKKAGTRSLAIPAEPAVDTYVGAPRAASRALPNRGARGDRKWLSSFWWQSGDYRANTKSMEAVEEK
jgi:hypothetical protein